jgi:hypothetical protein
VLVQCGGKEILPAPATWAFEPTQNRFMRALGEKMKPFLRLGEPAGESTLAVALTVAAVTMALMLCAILWQSSVIDSQRHVIQWMWFAKFGG